MKSSDEGKKDRKARKEEKQQQEFQEVMRKQEKENERQKFLRESKALLTELSQTYYEQMTSIWTEKARLVQWIEKVKEIYFKLKKRIQDIDSEIGEIKDSLLISAMRIKDPKIKQTVTNEMTPIYAEIQTFINNLIMQLNVFESGLKNYQENWSKPEKFIGSSEDYMQRRFDAFSMRAEIIEDMHVELENRVKSLAQQDDEVEKRVKPLKDLIKQIAQNAPEIQIPPYQIPAPFKIEIPPLIEPEAVVTDESRTQMIRKRDTLIYQSRILSSAEAKAERERMIAAQKTLESQQKTILHPIFALTNWGIKTSKLPKYSLSTGKLEGYFH
jgi:predicted nuclease with TOPRIM domain